jgi:hypothetical protein
MDRNVADGTDNAGMVAGKLGVAQGSKRPSPSWFRRDRSKKLKRRNFVQEQEPQEIIAQQGLQQAPGQVQVQGPQQDQETQRKGQEGKKRNQGKTKQKDGYLLKALKKNKEETAKLRKEMEVMKEEKKQGKGHPFNGGKSQGRGKNTVTGKRQGKGKGKGRDSGKGKGTIAGESKGTSSGKGKGKSNGHLSCNGFGVWHDYGKGKGVGGKG